VSLEEHHKFILNAMDRQNAIARKFVAELEAENARLKAECQARQAENSVLAVECDSLKSEVERLKADLNKMTKTPEGVDYVEVDVGFWTKSGSRLPSSYRTFWSNDKGVQS